MILLLKPLFNFHFEIFKNFMIFCHHLFWIETSSLFQKFKKNLYKIVGISTNLSVFFHLEINRQSEITNQEIKKHLCIFINYK